MEKNLDQISERISLLSDEELLEMLNIDFAQYREEAIDIAKAEIKKRGISFDPQADDQTAQSPAESSAKTVGIMSLKTATLFALIFTGIVAVIDAVNYFPYYRTLLDARDILWSLYVMSDVLWKIALTLFLGVLYARQQ